MRIGIFTAMKKESQSFLQHATNKVSVGDFDVFCLKLAQHEAFLCCPPTIGEIAASAACQLLISQFKVDVVLNFGVVGALTKSAQVLSTMYVGSVVHYDIDLSQIDGLPIGRYGCFDEVAVPTFPDLIIKAQQIQSLPVVRCASADKFVADSLAKQSLAQQFDAQICDMESAGILFACRFNNIPCLLVKCVSDSLTGGESEYSQNAEKAASNFFAFAKELAAIL